MHSHPLLYSGGQPVLRAPETGSDILPGKRSWETKAETTDRVLIIDDHREIRAVMTELLEINGYEVISAANGSEALSMLEDAHERPPCLILLDLMMPVMNGWDFLDALRKHPHFARLSVVIVSAYEDRAPREQVQGVLKKPVNFAALLEKVKHYCKPVR